MASKKTGVELEFSILDEGFTKSIREMNTALSSMKKELNLENEVLKNSGSTVNDYKNKLQTLKEQEELSRQKVEETRTAYEKVKNIMGENSAEAAKYKNKLTDAELEHQKITNAIDKTEKALVEQEQALKDNERKSRELNSAYGTLTTTISDQKSRLEDLKRQYISTVLEQGKGSTQAKNLKSEIRNLSAEINNNESKLNSATKEVEQFGKAEEDAGKKSITFKDLIKANLLSDFIKSGLKEIVNLAKSIGNTFIDIGKQALTSYADYEQLIGGVETLLGAKGAKSIEEYAELVGKSVDDVRGEYAKLEQSQKLVVANANNAYKTSGLNANQYMETITGFSASLLQSLGGDTIEAAKVGDMAVTDMSDNASKMGTSIENIQNAYQGFAKSNYTMLDNLKLG